MSDLEKTGNKLLASIRKTKAGSDTVAVKKAKKKTTTRKTAVSKTKTAAVSKPKAKVAAMKKPKNHVTARNKTRIKKAISVTQTNPFPDGSQVWPD